jgi:hypothetical protein
VLARILKALKEDLKVWNKQEFGDMGSKKKQLLGDLTMLNEKESLFGLSLVERQQRDICIADLASVPPRGDLLAAKVSCFVAQGGGQQHSVP